MGCPEIKIVEARRYLVKGCAPEICKIGQEYPVDQEGPVNQRKWTVTNLKGIFRTQRHPGFEKLATVQPSLIDDQLVLRAGNEEIHIPFDFQDGPPIKAKIWDCPFDAVVHPEGSQWISDVLQQQCKLVRKAGKRLINRPQFAPADMTANLSDRFHLLCISNETYMKLQRLMGVSLTLQELQDRTRPDVIIQGCEHAQEENRMASIRAGTVKAKGVKPCERCTIPDIDQRFGKTFDTRVTYALKKYFRHPNGEKIFGENFIVTEPGVMTIGEPIEVEEWRQEGWDRDYGS